jgi:predicted Zn-dependent peptidase
MNYLNSGCFTIFAATNSEKLEQALITIDGVLEDLRSGKYTDGEIKKAKEQIIIMYKLNLQTPESQAENFALNEIFGFGYDFDEKYLKMIKNATREEIEKAIKKYFTNSVTVITSPKKE